MKIPKFLKRKRNIIIIVVVLVVLAGLFLFLRERGGTSTIQTGTASNQNLQQTVLATGQVVSGTDLSLGFQSGGVVRRILVKEGDKVSKGNLLAALDEASAMATYTTAQGSLAQAQANYEKLMAGATSQNIQTVQDSITAAKQDLNNTYNSAIITLNNAYTSMFNASSVVVNVKNTYFALQDQQGIVVQEKHNDINASMDTAKKSMDAGNTDAAISQMILSLNNVFNDLSVIRTQCDQGMYYSNVSATDKTSLDTQKANVSASSTAVTTLQHSIASYQIALQKAEDQLALTKAPPTQAEIDLAQAQILSAQGQVASARAVLANSEIVAPANGTITLVDVKVGEQATAMKGVIVLQDIGDLHAEADVSEANIATLQVGQTIDYTFDALGPDQHFTGKVLTINPASTVVSGVVNYKIKGDFDNVPAIKPGMTANMTILVAKKDNVLAVPSTAVLNKNGKYFVRILDDVSDKKFHEVEVKTGLQADGGLIEITSGLSNGQQIIIYMKQ